MLRTILVVEDEALVRMDAADFFRQSGFDVIEAASADEALSTVRGRPHLCALFTDVEMPGNLNGLMLAHKIRQCFPQIVIVISSGKTLPDENALPSGARFLAKPYTAHDLKSVAEDIAGNC